MEEQGKVDENLQREPTEQEIKDYQAKMLSFYKAQIPFLKAQATYSDLMASIDEAKVRSLSAKMQYTQLSMAGMKKETDNKDGNTNQGNKDN